MALDTVAEVMYDGKVLISIGSAEYIIHRSAVEHARINGSLIDVNNTIGPKLKALEQRAQAGLVNPYRDAMDSIMEIHKEIPVTERRGMNKKDVSAVVAAIIRIAARHVQ
jgi:hypothetical protein